MRHKYVFKDYVILITHKLIIQILIFIYQNTLKILYRISIDYIIENKTFIIVGYNFRPVFYV